MSGSVRHSEVPQGERVPIAVRCIATGLYTGYIPWASGTFGSLLGLLLLLIPGAPGALFILIPLGFVIGVYSAGQIARAEGNRLNRTAVAVRATFQGGGHIQPDPSIVVIDEIVGMWIALAGVQPGATAFIAAFVLFRLCDVLKVQPARWLERLPGGWGIMLDDVAAGLYANVLTRCVLYVWTLTAHGGL
jgi:phosphatidylglycerophosphatase A